MSSLISFWMSLDGFTHTLVILVHTHGKKFGYFVLKGLNGSHLLFIGEEDYLLLIWRWSGIFQSCVLSYLLAGGNLFVRSGDYELTITWRSYIIVLSDYCQEIAISLYVKYTFEVNFSTRYKAQVWVVLLQHQVGYT